MKALVLVCALPLLLAACEQKHEDLKSPCVGAQGSPCDRRAPSENPHS